MFLRSVNAQVALLTTTTGNPLTSVLYPGIPLNAALLIGSVSFVVLATGNSIVVNIGLWNPRLSAIPHMRTFSINNQVIGQRFELPIAGYSDLLPGDELRLHGQAAVNNRIAVVENGMSVLIK